MCNLFVISGDDFTAETKSSHGTPVLSAGHEFMCCLCVISGDETKCFHGTPVLSTGHDFMCSFCVISGDDFTAEAKCSHGTPVLSAGRAVAGRQGPRGARHLW